MTIISDTAGATAAPAEVTLGGRAYRLSPLTDADVGELDNGVRARTIRAAREAGRGLPEPEAQALLRQAFAFAATQTWFGALGRDGSIDMLARLFWQLARRHQPDASAEVVRRAIAANPDELADALEAFDLLHDQPLMCLAEPAAPTGPRTGRPVLTFPTERDYREWHDRGS
jgi:hypothetical protein